MSTRIWTFWLFIGLALHIADVGLTIYLLESGEFFEGNVLLAWMFAEKNYFGVLMVKCFGWALIMAFAIHPLFEKHVTLTVVRLATFGMLAVVGWNTYWAFYLLAKIPVI